MTDSRVSSGPRGAAGATLASNPLLDVHDLRTRFRTKRGWVRAVDGIDLTLGRGRVLGIVGESGSGKSVASRSMMGTVRAGHDVKVSGEVAFEGVELTTLPIKQRRKLWGNDIAMIFQDPMTA